ncbi:hypothetical protein IC619_014795 [Hazenella sp. IB182353]|uniref:hypothetical protein n=1 Tax=Polycladospora coralii TaxID=2771432 RepID=UPI001746EE99|nr:hypothetical protein [Polycladospora coralii]MBS7531740.1 hypothetical protein [Polycladospora coralii]
MEGWNGVDADGKPVPALNRVWNMVEAAPTPGKAIKVVSILKGIFIHKGCGCPDGKDKVSDKDKENGGSSPQVSDQTKKHIHEGERVDDPDLPTHGKWNGSGLHNWNRMKELAQEQNMTFNSIRLDQDTGVRRVEVEYDHVDKTQDQSCGRRERYESECPKSYSIEYVPYLLHLISDARERYQHLSKYGDDYLYVSWMKVPEWIGKRFLALGGGNINVPCFMKANFDDEAYHLQGEKWIQFNTFIDSGVMKEVEDGYR